MTRVPRCKHPGCYVSCCEQMQEWPCCTGNTLWQAPRLCHVLQRTSHLPSPLCWFASLWQARRESPSVWPKQECVVYAVRENVNDITYTLSTILNSNKLIYSHLWPGMTVQDNCATLHKQLMLKVSYNAGASSLKLYKINYTPYTNVMLFLITLHKFTFKHLGQKAVQPL